MAVTRPAYCSREQVKRALDVKQTARSDWQVDRAIQSSARNIEGHLHRYFYPLDTTRYFDWPNFQYAYPWRIWFDQWDLVQATAVTTGGQPIPLSACNFEPVSSGPPYRYLELRRDLPYSFGVGATSQRNIAITGLFGYRNTETTAGVLVEVLDATETGIDVDGPTAAAVGVGSILRIDSERVIVTERQQLATGQTLGTGGLTNQNNATTVPVQSGAAFAVGEMILIDAERMLVEDIAGNNLIVRRAWDGSTIAAHTAGAAIYAPRTLVVTRGALGTTADTHGNASTIYRWTPPGGIRQLCVAEAITDLLQGRSGYARTAGTGENEREASGKGLSDLRDSTVQAYGRKARRRVI